MQAGPQGGAQRENTPPAAAYTRQLDRALVLFTAFPFPIVRNQAEDVWGDPIDGGEGNFHGPNDHEAENFKCIALKSAGL